MNLLAGLFLVTLVVVTLAVLRRQRALPRIALSSSLKDLIDRALVCVRSLDCEMDDLKQSFRPSAYMGIGGLMAWTPQMREHLLERLEHVKMCLGRMWSNVLTFEELGALASAFTMGQDKLAQEILTNAAGCKVELRRLERRIRIYDLVPISMWRLLGKGMAGTCLNLGNDLIQQYQSLAERVLAFAWGHGESYQDETLLSVL